jgi:predicted RNase H-like HicB family nuclease
VNNHSSRYETLHLTVTVSYSKDDEAFIARVSQMPGVATHGETPLSALKELTIALEGIYELLEERDSTESPAE